MQESIRICFLQQLDWKRFCLSQFGLLSTSCKRPRAALYVFPDIHRCNILQDHSHHYISSIWHHQLLRCRMRRNTSCRQRPCYSINNYSTMYSDDIYIPTASSISHCHLYFFRFAQMVLGLDCRGQHNRTAAGSA